MERSEYEPDGLVTAFFSEDFIERYETVLPDSIVRDAVRRVFPYCLFDMIQVTIPQRFAKALNLKIMDFCIVQVAILISIAQVKYSSQRRLARWFQI